MTNEISNVLLYKSVEIIIAQHNQHRQSSIRFLCQKYVLLLRQSISGIHEIIARKTVR